jgi:hypothetical protein
LKLDNVNVLPLATIGSSDKVAVTFKQFAGDVPVFNGSVSILFDAERKTVLALDTTGVPFADRVPVDFSEALKTDAIAAAKYAYANTFGVEATQINTIEPMIVGPSAYFGEDHILSSRGPTFAYHVKLSSPGTPDENGVPIAGEVFVASDLSILKVESTVHHLDPIKGNVRGNVNTGQEPNNASNQEQPFLPNVYIRQNNSSGAILATTNVNGRFRFAPSVSPINLFVELRGPYFNVNNQGSGGDASFTISSTEGSSHSIIFNPTKAEYTTAEVAGAYWVNRFRDYVKGVNPSDNKMDFSVTTNVNINSNCNAYFDGSSINMFRAQGGCPNTSYGSVIHHEEGHWANNVYNGSVTGAFHEGAADAWAYYINDSPCLAPDFFGPGSGCLRSGEQTNIKKCSGSCNESCHGGGSHTEGQVLGGALWKVRSNLQASLGQSAGGDVADGLFMGWWNAYNDNAICTVIEDHWLVLDDDDGNLSNGTPHKAEIDAGFVEQGWPGVP